MNVSWRRSARDQRVHAFEEVAEPGRGYLEAICEHSVPPVLTEPEGHRGHWQALLDPDTCLGCLVLVSDQLADAGQHGPPLP